MNNTIFIQISALVYCILLVIIYFSKKRYEIIENKIYGYLIITNFLGLIIDIVLGIISSGNYNFLILYVTTKLYLIYFITWIGLFTLYIIALSHHTNDSKRFKNFNIFKYLKINFLTLGIIYTICIVSIIILPTYFSHSDSGSYAYGPSSNFAYLASLICIVICIISLIKNINKVNKVKYVPVFALLSVGIVIMAIQALNPKLILIPAFETFITFLMYFTIENPDLKMITELNQNKRILEQVSIERSNFLFKITQNIRRPIDYIKEVSQNALTLKNKNEIQKELEKVYLNANQLSFYINEALNLSDIDIKKLKIASTRYNPTLLLEQIVTKFSKEIDPNIRFTFNISKDMPKLLYGDSIKLKQIITAILENSKNSTKKGFIEISASTIVRYSVCRLIITISDSGKGMPIEVVNDILSETDEIKENDIEKVINSNLNLKTIRKVVRLLGGDISIKSEVGTGTVLILILEQKIYEEKEKQTLKTYQESLFRKTKILIVDDDYQELNNITKIIKEYNVDVVTTYTGEDAVNKVTSGEKFDLIIMDDAMYKGDAINYLYKLKEIKKFKTPVIIMLEKDKEFIKHHYIEDGFQDYILKENMENELNKITKKYLN
ncbi:MAG: response regulator [Bacilli bacterium]